MESKSMTMIVYSLSYAKMAKRVWSLLTGSVCIKVFFINGHLSVYDRKFVFWMPENFSKKHLHVFSLSYYANFSLKWDFFGGGRCWKHIFNKEKALFIKIFNNFYSQTVYYTNISGKKRDKSFHLIVCTLSIVPQFKWNIFSPNSMVMLPGVGGERGVFLFE